MTGSPIIQVKEVSFGFVVRQGGIHTLKEMLHQIGRTRPFERKKVIDSISFNIQKGECFAIMGKNGCGKSTLLRMISGIIEPDKGKIEVNGHIAPLLALGVGLEPELSGYDNIKLSALITGIPKHQLPAMMKEIVSFSELTEQDLHMQVKRYSSGMTARLAFSIALASSAHILIIDEILAVGDEGFQNKCYQRITELKKTGTTIIFVSHSTGDVEKICDRGILLENGKISFEGDCKNLIEKYHQLFI